MLLIKLKTNNDFIYYVNCNWNPIYEPTVLKVEVEKLISANDSES